MIVGVIVGVLYGAIMWWLGYVSGRDSVKIEALEKSTESARQTQAASERTIVALRNHARVVQAVGEFADNCVRDPATGGMFASHETLVELYRAIDAAGSVQEET